VRWLALTLLGVLLVGCGEQQHSDHGAEIPASATRAVDCPDPLYRKGHGDYDSGLEKVTDDARKAMESWLDEEGVGLPDVRYDEAARHGDTAYFTWTSGGEVLAAFVVRDGMDDVEGHHGWGVASYAYCDPSQWPPDQADEVGIQVWTDADGDPVSTSLVYSYQGHYNCGYDDMTVLFMGKDRYYGNPPTDFDGFLTTTYTPHSELPPDARDTGYERDGRELSLTTDAAYLVGPDDAERWPTEKTQIACD
jgi:hypothetical protein